jgi:hypothetical protein
MDRRHQPRVMRIAAKYAQWFNMSNPGTPADERIPEMRGARCRVRGREGDPATLRAQPLRARVRRADAPRGGRARGRSLKRANMPRDQWLAGRKGAIVGTPDEAGERSAPSRRPASLTRT